jgi:Pol polyprotein, beta-barrel domain
MAQICSAIVISTDTSAFSSFDSDSHFWLVDSAASSHICGDIHLFESIHVITPVTIKIPGGKTFMANKRGTVHITIRSNPSSGLDDTPITLLNVIYVPRLKVNLLSIERIISAKVMVRLTRSYSTLSFDNAIFAQGPKIGDLYAYKATTSISHRKQAESSTEQDISTPMVPIHIPSPSLSPNDQLPEVEDTKDREVPKDTPDIREGEAQEIEGMDGPGAAKEQDNSAEEQDLGARQDFEKDERIDPAIISCGSDESRIETSNLNVSALADDANDQ